MVHLDRLCPFVIGQLLLESESPSYLTVPSLVDKYLLRYLLCDFVIQPSGALCRIDTGLVLSPMSNSSGSSEAVLPFVSHVP